MPTITLKDIPRDLHRELKNRAKAHHRSLNREVLATLRNSTSNTQPIDAATLTRAARAMRKKFKRQVSAAEIMAWKRHGRL
jgi:plasmid stability protein